jgi:glycosyltransferase involved in cell wall biosynthesis
MPRVSVIIPAYNASAFLKAALDSVLRQTYTDWEVVLVDDGSTDNTRAIAEAAAPAFGGRLNYIYQTNHGMSAARNTAIRAAKGEFLGLLDSDDIWRTRRLELGVAMMDKDPDLGLVHGKVARINLAGEFIEYPPSPPREYLEGKIARLIYTRRAHVLCCTVLIRKSCVDAVGPFDETLRATEDRDLWFRIAELYRVGYIDEVIADYRMSPNSVTKDEKRVLAGQTQFIEKHLQRGACTRMAAREARGGVYRERGDSLFNAGDLGQALRYYSRSVLQFPFNLANNYMLVRALGEPFVGRFLNRTRTG